MKETNRRAVVLLSGGLDSSTVLAIARHEGYETYALSIDYGQHHHVELQAAEKMARQLEAKQHVVAKIDLRMFGGSALTSEVPIPKGRNLAEMGADIPITYVPARNTVFLSFALAWAEVLETGNIFIGVNALDYSGYPDCRPEFIAAFETMANLATKTGVERTTVCKIHTPLIALTKSAIIKRGLELGVDYSMTSSCYDPSESREGCGQCDSCLLRLRGFAELGVSDPLRYRTIGE